MIPDTNVPCPDASWSGEPPTKLREPEIFFASSGWFASTPESITATGTPKSGGNVGQLS